MKSRYQTHEMASEMRLGTHAHMRLADGWWRMIIERAAITGATARGANHLPSGWLLASFRPEDFALTP